MSDDEVEDEGRKVWRPSPQQWSIAVVVICLAALVLAYRILAGNGLEQTAAMFIGLPTLLSLILVLTPEARTGFGTAMKVTALFLALSGIILQEGFICILIASPIFFGVVAICAALTTDRGEHSRRRSFLLLPFLVMSLEGVHSNFEFDRNEMVAVKRATTLSCADFMAGLAQPLDVSAELPLFLKLGFPAPQSCVGAGLEVGDRRRIHFAGGEGKPGDLVLEVKARSATSVTFRCLQDTSHIAHWMDWQEVCFSWSEGEVRAELHYDRLLDPAWYFRPIERYGVRCAGEHLLATFFAR